MVYSMFLRNYTPKTNMEPENHLIEKENHLNHPPPWLWVLSRTFRFCLASCFAATGDVEDARLDCYSVVVIFQKFCTTWDKHTHYCWWQPEIWKTHQLRVVASWNPPCFFFGFDAYRVVLWDFWTINSSGDGFVQQNNPTNSVAGLDLKMFS